MDINKDYFKIKDNCRHGLLKYLEKAISKIPTIKNPQILDAGCGTGVPTLLLAGKFKGHITAVDSDAKSMNTLAEKVKNLNLSDRITLLNCSIFDMDLDKSHFDLILAEGLLNAVGFKKGFLRIITLLKRNRFLILHDEILNKNEKIDFIEKNDCKILSSFVLDEHIWWSDYFKCLEQEISAISNKELLTLFKSDLREIKMLKKNPSTYVSAYYIIEKI